jgi:hypothetical protein
MEEAQDQTPSLKVLSRPESQWSGSLTRTLRVDREKKEPLLAQTVCIHLQAESEIAGRQCGSHVACRVGPTQAQDLKSCHSATNLGNLQQHFLLR